MSNNALKKLQYLKPHFEKKHYSFYLKVIKTLDFKPSSLFASDLKPYLEMHFPKIKENISMYGFVSDSNLKILIIDDKTDKVLFQTNGKIITEHDVNLIINDFKKVVEDLV